MKLIKISVVLIIVVVIAVGGALFWLSSNINDLVKAVVEQVGTETLKTTVTLEAVDVRLTEGQAQLIGLKIANPKNFTQPNAFEMDKIVVDLNLEVLMEKTVHIKEITIDGGSKWTGNTGSGSELDIADFILTSGAGTYAIHSFDFSKNMTGSTISIVFTMSDASTKSTGDFSP